MLYDKELVPYVTVGLLSRFKLDGQSFHACFYGKISKFEHGLIGFRLKIPVVKFNSALLRVAKLNVSRIEAMLASSKTHIFFEVGIWIHKRLFNRNSLSLETMQLKVILCYKVHYPDLH